MNFLKFLFFGVFMLFLSGIANGQDGTRKLSGSGNPYDTMYNVGEWQEMKHAGKGNIRLSYYDNNGIRKDTSNLFETKSPVINTQAGYQLIATDQVISSVKYNVREGAWINEQNSPRKYIMVTADSTFDHTTNAGKIMYALSSSYGDTITSFLNNFIDDPLYDDRNFTSAKLPNGDIVTAYSVYDASTNPITLKWVGYRLTDSNLVIKDSFHRVYPQTLPSPGFNGGGFFSASRSSNGKTYFSYGHVGQNEIMRYEDTGMVSVTILPLNLASEMSIKFLSSQNQFIGIARIECTGGDTCGHYVYSANADWSNIQGNGYRVFNSNQNNSTRCPAGIFYDNLTDQVIVSVGQRNGQTDSMTEYTAPTASALNNTGWIKSNVFEKPYVTIGNEYWYASPTRGANGYIHWIYTSRVVSGNYENANIWDYWNKYIPINSNGGISEVRGMGKALVKNFATGIYNFRNIRSISGALGVNTNMQVLTYTSTDFYPQWRNKDTLAASLQAVTTNGNVTTTGIVQQPVTNFKIGSSMAGMYMATSQTGGIRITHPRLASALFHTWTAYVNIPTSPKISCEIDFSFGIQSATGVYSTLNLGAYVSKIVGTLPFSTDSLFATIIGGDSMLIRIGGVATIWPAGTVVTLKNTTVQGASATNVSNTTWNNGFVMGITTDASSPNAIRTPLVTTALTSASALNGANLTDGTVISEKIRDTTIRAQDMKPNVTRSSASTLTLAYSNEYTFTGTTTTYTLPAIATATLGRAQGIWITNSGSGNITLNTNASANVLYLSTGIGSLTNTLNIIPAQTYFIRPDGVNWIVTLVQ